MQQLCQLTYLILTAATNRVKMTTFTPKLMKLTSHLPAFLHSQMTSILIT